MIRRLIRWVYPDIKVAEDAAAKLAAVINEMPMDQQAEMFTRHAELWHHACAVATWSDIRRGRR
ncbi:hypothetical protein AB0I81_22745 [Nonomuraea sp. NPDC050404]|uniref:hypothetical protein n=1 Tax=Nonomuraea sp. NPDC050404 TaxID=3155783 RepID=UPI0033C4AA6E